MKYLIDGYNFLFYSRFDTEDLLRSRNLFLQALSVKNQNRNLDIVVFFDANTGDAFSGRTSFSGIDVIFAAGYENADAAILEAVERSSNPKEITVVSRDKGLIRSTSSCGAQVLTPKEFLEFISKKPKKKSAKKIEIQYSLTVIESEFARWLRLFTN